MIYSTQERIQLIITFQPQILKTTWIQLHFPEKKTRINQSLMLKTIYFNLKENLLRFRFGDVCVFIHSAVWCPVLPVSEDQCFECSECSSPEWAQTSATTIPARPPSTYNTRTHAYYVRLWWGKGRVNNILIDTETLTCRAQERFSWLWLLWSAGWCECRETLRCYRNNLTGTWPDSSADRQTYTFHSQTWPAVC